MSVLNTAETGSSPDIPRRRLRVATPVAGQDDGLPTSPLGAGATKESDPAASAPDDGRPPLAATELHTAELRVREIRVVREASVRTLRAGGSQPPAAQARAAQILAVTRTQQAARARSAAVRAPGLQARTATQARPAGAQTPGVQARAAGSTRAAVSTGAATQTRVVTHGRATYTRAARVRATRTRTVSRRPGAVRLTRRGRLVVAGFAMLVVVVAATLLWMTVAGSVQAASQGGPAPRSPYQGMTQVVVRPGQTLWSIAAAAEPSANTWTVVQQITQVNALNGPVVRAGQLLWVPKG
ncbi:MAG TPA: LysM peptidoglycan-binding domain-containing protein [Streptosporangiaceae bacterium]|nr:LysM peptidoglycan-binding domain-containing protein [Streptosporangiaceae bacterium]